MSFLPYPVQQQYSLKVRNVFFGPPGILKCPNFWGSTPAVSKSAGSQPSRPPVGDSPGLGMFVPMVTGTGGSGGNSPSQLGNCGGAAHPTWTVNVVHFYFCLVLHVSLGFSQKSRPNLGSSEVLGRDYLGPRETFAPPPPHTHTHSHTLK